MDEIRTGLLNSLHHIISAQIIYMYFLDFNLVTLILHVIQLVLVYHGGKHSTSRRAGVTSFQKSIFICIVLFTNLPVVLLHIFSPKTSPIVLTFVGRSDFAIRADLPTLLFNDFVIIVFETFVVLNQKLIAC